MKSWRERILKEFVPKAARLTLVADPDTLLTDEVLQQELRDRGFEIVPYGNDPVAFRFLYETRFRSHWDRGQATLDLVVTVNDHAALTRTLPADLQQRGRTLEFGLGELFPNLNTPVLTTLDRRWLDRVHEAYREQRPSVLTESRSKDFLLRHVFGIAPETITEPQHLLRALLQRHFPGESLPRLLADRWVHLLREGGRFPGWPLEKIVPDREAFLSFLQEQWPAFAQTWLDETLGAVAEEHRPRVREPSRFQWPRGLGVPFGHPDVRVYIDNLFVEGVLRPVEVTHADAIDRSAELRRSWISLGLKLDPEAVQGQRLERLLQRAEATLPDEEARHPEWQSFAAVWAELLAAWHEAVASRSAFSSRVAALQERVDSRFLTWMQTRYAVLHNVPGTSPVMVHHIARSLARDLQAGRSRKAALVVMDGLALDQWVVLRDGLQSGSSSLAIVESSVFTWVPTITPVARQAIFAGRPPLFFADSIDRTDRDAARWQRFWSSRDVSPSRVRYLAGIREPEHLPAVEELASHPQVQVLGLVVDKVDRTMHGMQYGAAGMHASMRHWAGEGFLPRLVELLLAHSFVVYLTSDHGSVEARGIGRPQEGAVAETRGERVRVYSSPLMRDQTLSRFPDATAWSSPGLPESYHPLIAPPRQAFTAAGERIVAHGGISVEEVIVPFVRIAQQTR
ncbi:MAG: BREX-3 system phosphatase PglZ [Gemmatimonadetes bacterium]|jgi:hypothetical protein|nr:BREX-3 system phosphatase PglZ [Gemmatimonadota bacterium]MBA4157044.1 BREX-3 system phosphatase PglZ [Gemmatimonadota bacterium]